MLPGMNGRIFERGPQHFYQSLRLEALLIYGWMV